MYNVIQYNGTHFFVSSIHFCGGDKKDFDARKNALKKGLNDAAKSLARINAEQTLKLTFNDDYWDTIYGFKSEPIPFEKGRQLCVRVVSQFG